jgi:TRAP transporter T-component
MAYNSRSFMQRWSPNTHKLLLAGLLALALLPWLPGCSLKRLAVNKVGNALAGSGSTFASDDDPDLVKAAVPFSVKPMENLLAENPNHKGLLLASASASGFSQVRDRTGRELSAMRSRHFPCDVPGLTGCDISGVNA